VKNNKSKYIEIFKKMIDINLDDFATSVEKIVLNSKSFGHTFNNYSILDYILSYSSIKCYKSLPSITTLEAKGRSIIKIHKTIYLNLLNLVNIDLSDNKLLKISKNFRLFKNLKSLKLDNNQISFIPSFIGELSQLEVFSISKNLLSIIPTSIQDLSKLKTFCFSNNKIENMPIEFGQLNSLNILYMDCNYFTKIPTTLCYLKKLKELSFDWLEFVYPPYYKNIKESIGKTIINIIQKALENMLKKGILYCEFKTFVEEISSKKSDNENNNNNNNVQISEQNESLINSSGLNALKNSQFGGQSSMTLKSNYINIYNNNKFAKIFNAIENGYYGVVKSMLEGENGYEYLTVKNIENKTPLYYSMAKNNELIELFLSKIKEHKIEISYTYLLRAIRMRNPELVKKLVYLGADVDSIDDQGRGVFHILFSIFNKQISKCILIADFLLSFYPSVNKLDNENWGPIHLAAKRGSKECLLWIISRNKKLKNEGREEFDLNLKGKNNWTPLHLCVYSLRIEETMILLEYGCDIFARNIEAQTPKQVCVCNFVFSKLLSYYEFLTLDKIYFYKIFNDNEKKIKKKNNKYILLDSDSYLDDKKSNLKEINSSSDYEDDNIIINNSVTISSIVKKTINKSEKKENKNLKNKSANNLNNKNKIIKKRKTEIIKVKNATMNLVSSIESDQFCKTSSKEMLNIISKTNFNHSMKQNNEILGRIKKDKKTKNCSKIINSKNKNENGKIRKKDLININININSLNNTEYNNSLDKQKDRLLSSESSNLEKYQSFMEIKLNKHCENEIIKNLLDNIVTENSMNIILLSDIFNYIITNMLFNLIPTLKNLLENKIINKKIYIKNELQDTITLLENMQKNPANVSFFKKKSEKFFKHLSPMNQKLSKKIYGDDDDEDNKMFYQNSEEINNSDDIEEFDNNLNFEEMNNLFKNTEQNIKAYKQNKNKGKDKDNNILKNKEIINNKKKEGSLKKGSIVDISIKLSNISNKKNQNKKEIKDNKKKIPLNSKNSPTQKKKNEKEKEKGNSYLHKKNK